MALLEDAETGEGDFLPFHHRALYLVDRHIHDFFRSGPVASASGDPIDELCLVHESYPPDKVLEPYQLVKRTL
ncbi:hypothetical protein GCM10009830_12680 [Glycomyces endophyticus]|uniref:Uncharacterized protein n=1 Tax=Glycomyces endophyticus TaxID=480996 RepID=A0ABP4S6X0_9ACTN